MPKSKVPVVEVGDASVGIEVMLNLAGVIETLLVTPLWAGFVSWHQAAFGLEVSRFYHLISILTPRLNFFQWRQEVRHFVSFFLRNSAPLRSFVFTLALVFVRSQSQFEVEIAPIRLRP